MDAYDQGWCDGANAMIQASRRNADHFKMLAGTPGDTVVGQTITAMLEGIENYVVLPPFSLSDGRTAHIILQDGRYIECPPPEPK